MPNQPSHPESQIERAEKLRKQIERLKKGLPRDDEGSEDKSLKEQIEEREAEEKKRPKTENDLRRDG